MNEIAEKIRKDFAAARPKLLALDPALARQKNSPDVWSRQETLGHLIDSALNNHQRIVRASHNAAADFPTYDQNRWVQVQRFGEMNWLELVDLFSLINNHLCRVIDHLPEDVLGNPCNIGRQTPVTLRFVIEDYHRHLRLHLEQVLR